MARQPACQPADANAATVHSAIDAAGLAPVYGSDYRAYYDERARANPNFGGFHFDADQTYLIVIGRRPS